MRFVKMHGIGNDYIYVNGFDQAIEDPAALAVEISDRHFGVGSDGLILVLPADKTATHVIGEDAVTRGDGSAHLRMRIFNTDGSEAEMCGNGIRCVCKLAHDHGLVNENPMRVQTGHGILCVQYTTDEAGKVDQVTVDMGRPILEPAQIPVKIANLSRIVNHSIRTLIKWPAALGPRWMDDCGLDQRMTCLSMGNPHAVFFCNRIDRVPLATVGPTVEHHKIFPKRANVHFVQVRSPTEVKIRTWERGSGATLACGTGASAVCAAGVLTDRTQHHIHAHLPGGDLKLEWRRRDNHIHMTGAATEVFTGDWP